ncbi:MAG: hypothetical protein AMXMBFR44_2640 [Candidatus Campbellbacteria bacterium]
MRTSFSGFLGIAVFLFFAPLFVFAATFSRDLSLGDSGQDVLELQRLLNEDERTQIAALGPGSPGNETMYFGLLTADAVRRYQEAHASEILTPLGLFAGTGFFGRSTRAHLLASQVTDSKRPDERYVLKILGIEPKSGGVGTEVTIYGTGFTATGNRVGSAFEEWGLIDSPDGETLTFTVQGPFPEDFLEEHGDFFRDAAGTMEYQIGVINGRNERSNFIPFSFIF